MASAKDMCFAAAVDAYQELAKEAGIPWKFKVLNQTPWIQDVGNWGKPWKMAEGFVGVYVHLMNYVSKYFKYSSLIQVRFPDVTIKFPDGKAMVLDNKFTQADGSVDKWGTANGAGNGNTQQADYNQINQEQGKYHDSDPSLTPRKCKCNEKKQQKKLVPQEVVVRVPVRAPQMAPGLYPFMIPEGGVPVMPEVTVPEFPVVEFPVLEPIFIP